MKTYLFLLAVLLSASTIQAQKISPEMYSKASYSSILPTEEKNLGLSIQPIIPGLNNQAKGTVSDDFLYRLEVYSKINLSAIVLAEERNLGLSIHPIVPGLNSQANATMTDGFLCKEKSLANFGVNIGGRLRYSLGRNLGASLGLEGGIIRYYQKHVRYSKFTGTIYGYMYYSYANLGNYATNFYEEGDFGATPSEDQMKVSMVFLNIPILVHCSVLNKKMNLFAGLSLQFLIKSTRKFQSFATIYNNTNIYVPAFDDKNTTNKGLNTLIPTLEGGLQFPISPKIKAEFSVSYSLKDIYKPLNTAIVDYGKYKSKINSFQMGLNYTLFQK